MFSNENMKEAISGESEITDIEPDAIETMLYFLYKQKVKVG